ncbi:MAG: 50S ribosomal protein L24 [Candidatus Gracilibacteria bacterium]
MKIKKGDMVVVITGKDRNKTGKVIRVLKKTGRVVVEGLNKVIRHMKKTKTQAGQKVSFEAPLHASNVMVLDPKTKKGTRIGYKVTKDGKKERIAKKSNTVL